LEFDMKLATILRPACGVLLLLACTVGAVNAAETSTPVMLVATDRLAGSGYAETVLFAAPLRNGAHIGFIMNRPTRLQLSDLFPEHVPSRRVKEPVYFGGPILAEMLFSVTRGVPEGAGETLALMPGLILVVDGPTVDRVIETMPNDARYFAGLVIWQPGELAEELRAGAWEVLPADAKAVFDTNPGGMWKGLHAAPGMKRAAYVQDQPL